MCYTFKYHRMYARSIVNMQSQNLDFHAGKLVCSTKELSEFTFYLNSPLRRRHYKFTNCFPLCSIIDTQLQLMPLSR